MKLALAFAAALALLGCEKKKAAPATPSAPTATTPPPAGAVPAAPVPVEASPDGLKLGSQAPKVGEVRTEREEQLTNLKVDAGGKTIEIVGSERKVERQEVVAATGDVVDKLKLTFVEFDKQEKIGGKDRPAKGSVAGKTYLVWREGKQLKATTEAGAAVPDEEVKEVVGSSRGVGRPQAMESIMAKQVWKVGARYDLTADDLAKLNDPATHGDDEPTLTSGSMTLQSSAGGNATFAMEMKLLQGAGGAEMEVLLRGTVVLEIATGRTVSLDSVGTIGGKMGGAPVAGELKVKTTYQYGG